MQSLPLAYRALIIGASGAIGGAMAAQLRADPRCAQVIALGRDSTPPIDFADSASVAAAIADLGGVEVGVDAGADGAGSSLDARCELVGFAAGSHLYAKSWLGRAFCAAYAARAGFGWRKSFEVNGNE